jgi:hypothetical protein
MKWRKNNEGSVTAPKWSYLILTYHPTTPPPTQTHIHTKERAVDRNFLPEFLNATI